VVVAITLNAMGTLYEEIGDAKNAEASYREALSIAAAQLSADDLTVVDIENNLGRLQTKIGKLVEADSLLRHAHTVRVARLTAAHVDAQETLIYLAAVAIKAGNYALAQERVAQVNDFALKHRPKQTNAAEASKIWQARSDFAKQFFGVEHLIYQRTLQTQTHSNIDRKL
jgi:Tfp pilus assembly protein PilF